MFLRADDLAGVSDYPSELVTATTDYFNSCS